MLTALIRVLGTVFSLCLLSVLIFVLAHAAPGDPLQSFFGNAADSLDAAQRLQALDALGLNRPLYQQYFSWLQQIFQGNWGMSLIYRMPVQHLLPLYLLNTLILGGIAFLLIAVLALILALICARFEGRLTDRLICSLGSASYFLPSFWLGVILILIFAVNLRLLPPGGAYDPGQSASLLNRSIHLLLPLAVLVLSHVWYYGALLRSRLLEELRADYILTAKACGLSSVQILISQALRTMLPFMLQLCAIALPHILGGTFVVEAVFNYPGAGLLIVQSAKGHDYNLLLALVLLSGFVMICSALLAHILSAYFDFRLRARPEASWLH